MKIISSRPDDEFEVLPIAAQYLVDDMVDTYAHISTILNALATKLSASTRVVSLHTPGSNNIVLNTITTPEYDLMRALVPHINLLDEQLSTLFAFR